MHAASGQIIDHYERHALTWDRDRGKTLFERRWLDRFLRLAPKGSDILDLGCGSGEPLARYFIEAGHRVSGIDASASMIGLCRQRFPEQDWTVADMRGLDLGWRFGGILAWDSFFHLTPDDQRRMFAVFRSHAAQGAALMFTSGPSAGEAIGSYQSEDLYHASLDPAEYTTLLTAHGFRVIAHIAEDRDCGGRTVWLAQSG